MSNDSQGRLAGRRAVVAGGGGNVGAGVCERLLAEGAEVVATDWNAEALELLVKNLEAPAGRLHTTVMDMGDPGDVADGVSRAAQLLGGLDIAVNTVGISHQGSPFDEETVDGWAQVIAVNLTGAFAFAKAVAEVMTTGGAIVNVSSGGAERGLPLNLAYGASKGGLRNLTLGLSLALAERGIRVNAVGPGLMDHPMKNDKTVVDARVGRSETVPLGRLGTGADIGAAVAYLVSDDASWVTGQNLYVDGGGLAR